MTDSTAASVTQPIAARRNSFGPTASAGLLSFGLLAATAAGWASLRWSPYIRPEFVVGIWLNIVIILLAILFEARRRPYSLHLMHMVAMFLFLGAASLFQYSSGNFPVAGSVQGLQAEMAPTIASVTFWLVGYLVAYEGYGLLVRKQRGPTLRFLSRSVTPLRALVVLAFALASLAYLAALGLSGAETRGAAENALLDATYQSGAGAFSLPYKLVHGVLLRGFSAVALLAVVLLLARNKRTRKPAVLFLTIATIIAVFVVSNPFAASRMWFATFVIAFVAPLVLHRYKTGWGLTAIALFGIALLPALHETRDVETLDEIIGYVGLVSPIDYLATNADVDSLGMTALCMKWAESHDPRLGLQTLGSILFWFPRALWPNKPIETGAMVTGDLGFSFTNWAPPIMADAIVDFGLIGVPFIAALYGLLFARMDRCYWESRAPSGVVRVIDCIYPLWIGCVLFMTRGGSFASFTYTVGFTFWIVVLGFGGRQPLPAAATPQRS